MRVSAGSAGRERPRGAAGADAARACSAVDPGRGSRGRCCSRDAPAAETRACSPRRRRPRRTLPPPPACAGWSRSHRRSRAPASARDRGDGILDVERRVVPVAARRRRTRRSASAATATAPPGGRAGRCASQQPYPCWHSYCVERRAARREEVVHLVRLAHEIEVVDLRRMRGCLDRRQARVRDRRRRQPGELARVVRVVALQAATRGSTGSGGCGGRSEAWRRCRAASSGAAGCRSRLPQAALRGRERLLLDHRGDLQHVVRGQVLRVRVRQVDTAPLLAERLELLLDELARGCGGQEVVGRRKQESLEVRALEGREASARCPCGSRRGRPWRSA